MISLTLAAEGPLTVAYLGPEGTYSHTAALRHFGHSARAQAQPGIEDVFRALETQAAHLGVLPAENSSEGAITATLDRLLDSPHYGERWGRHWLDLVRYAESTANDANAVMRYAWRYRNYVIEAFNSDLPCDQFLIEQLAGDLLPLTESVAVNTRRTMATGYLMIGPKALADTDKEQSRLDIGPYLSQR